MYESYYGLRELPFELTPNPRYLFLSAGHREALSNLQYGISGQKGVTLLVGEAGTGKTTLVRAALELEQQQSAQCIYLSNPTLTRSEFVEFLAGGFALSPQAANSKAVFLRELERTLLDRRGRSLVTALIVDEAQSLPHDLLEEVRLLTNIETETEKLLPVVLVGQPELADRLNEPSLRQLKQRVALRCDLQPLDLQETAAYIAGRIRSAGGDSARVFTREAVILIYERSRGIPRTISVLCDNALVTGFATDRRPVGRDLVSEVCRDFDFTSSGAPPPDGGALQAETSAARAGLRRAGAQREAQAEPERSSAQESSAGRLVSTAGRRRRFSFF